MKKKYFIIYIDKSLIIKQHELDFKRVLSYVNQHLSTKKQTSKQKDGKIIRGPYLTLDKAKEEILFKMFGVYVASFGNATLGCVNLMRYSALVVECSKVEEKATLTNIISVRVFYGRDFILKNTRRALYEHDLHGQLTKLKTANTEFYKKLKIKEIDKFLTDDIKVILYGQYLANKVEKLSIGKGNSVYKELSLEKKMDFQTKLAREKKPYSEYAYYKYVYKQLKNNSFLDKSIKKEIDFFNTISRISLYKKYLCYRIHIIRYTDGALRKEMEKFKPPELLLLDNFGRKEEAIKIVKLQIFKSQLTCKNYKRELYIMQMRKLFAFLSLAQPLKKSGQRPRKMTSGTIIKNYQKYNDWGKIATDYLKIIFAFLCYGRREKQSINLFKMLPLYNEFKKLVKNPENSTVIISHDSKGVRLLTTRKCKANKNLKL